MCLLPVLLHLPHLLLLLAPGVCQLLLLIHPLLLHLVMLLLPLDDPAGPLVLHGHDLPEAHPMSLGLFSLAPEVEDALNTPGRTLCHEALRVLRSERALQDTMRDAVQRGLDEAVLVGWVR